MHVLDIFICIVTAVFVGLGIRRGCIGEIFRLAAVVLGFIGAYLMHAQVAARLNFLAVPDSLRATLSFLGAYVVIALSVVTVGWVIRKIVHLTLLGWLDRLLGGCIGMVKTLVLAWVVVLCVSAVPASRFHTSIGSSLTYRFFIFLPLRLKSSPAASSLTGVPASVDIARPMENVHAAREKFEGFRNMVDSAKARADSIKKQYLLRD
jgi:membrane protein required for colicin V production